MNPRPIPISQLGFVAARAVGIALRVANGKISSAEAGAEFFRLVPIMRPPAPK
jgi:hypothetical protein